MEILATISTHQYREKELHQMTGHKIGNDTKHRPHDGKYGTKPV